MSYLQLDEDELSRNMGVGFPHGTTAYLIHWRLYFKHEMVLTVRANMSLQVCTLYKTTELQNKNGLNSCTKNAE